MPSSKHSSSKDIILNIAENRIGSFDIFIKTFQKTIQSFIYKISKNPDQISEDILQEIYLEIFLSSKSFKGLSKVETWLFSIVRNTLYKSFKPGLNKQYLTDYYQQVHNQEKPECAYIDFQVLSLLTNILNKMNNDYEEVFILYFFNQLSYKEISELTNVNIGTVKSRLYYSRSMVKSYFKKHLKP